MPKDHGDKPARIHTDWRNRHLDHLERLHAGANAGLCGDGGMIVVVADVLERNWLVQKRKQS